MTTPTPDEICERLLSEAANLESDFEPDDPNADVYRATVAQLRADAAFIHSQQATILKLTAGDEGWRLQCEEQQATIERLSAALEDAPDFVQRAFVAGFLAHMRNERADPFNEWEASEIRKESAALGKDANNG